MLGTLELVRTSDWATVAASLAIMSEVEQGRLIAEPIHGPELWVDYHLIRAKDALLSVACRDFLHRLTETVERLGEAHKPNPSWRRVNQHSRLLVRA